MACKLLLFEERAEAKWTHLCLMVHQPRLFPSGKLRRHVWEHLEQTGRTAGIVCIEQEYTSVNWTPACWAEG